jgi:excisionase family DNA binding protein
MRLIAVKCNQKGEKRLKNKRTRQKGSEDCATWKVAEAARVARCGEQAIRRGIAQGRIPHLRLSRNIVIPKTTFLRWLENCGVEK